MTPPPDLTERFLTDILVGGLIVHLTEAPAYRDDIQLVRDAFAPVLAAVWEAGRQAGLAEADTEDQTPICENGDCRDHYGDPLAWCAKCRKAAEPSPEAAPAPETPKLSCCEPCPDRSGRACDKPRGHEDDHWTYGGNTKTWPKADAAPRVETAPAQRSEKLLRDTLRMLCDVIWNGGRTKPGQHVWSIPVDKERDFDCILSDAIDELVALRNPPIDWQARALQAEQRVANLKWDMDCIAAQLGLTSREDLPTAVMHFTQQATKRAEVAESRAEAAEAALREERAK